MASDAPDGPDIYVILLDGYPRADVLQYAFGIDNSPFTDALSARGFTVATASHSDYLWTHVSVPSALNLAYVEQIPAMLDVIEGRAPRQPTLRTTIADNVAFEVARQHGMMTVAVASGFEEVAPRRADVYIDGGELNEFEISLLSSTFAGDVLNVRGRTRLRLGSATGSDPVQSRRAGGCRGRRYRAAADVRPCPRAPPADRVRRGRKRRSRADHAPLLRRLTAGTG